MSGVILVISGPSGCGKSSLLSELFKHDDNYYFSISTTTRAIRDGEKEGVDYYYITKDEFEQGIEEGQFLEYAKVHDNYYGTSLKPVLNALSEEKLVIFDIDVQGHSIVRQKFSDITTSLFITTPTKEILRQRLIKRATDSMAAIEHRLKNAKYEMARIHEYEYLLINDDFDKSYEKFCSIVDASRLKISSNEIGKFIQNW